MRQLEKEKEEENVFNFRLWFFWKLSWFIILFDLSHLCIRSFPLSIRSSPIISKTLKSSIDSWIPFPWESTLKNNTKKQLINQLLTLALLSLITLSTRKSSKVSKVSSTNEPIKSDISRCNLLKKQKSSRKPYCLYKTKWGHICQNWKTWKKTSKHLSIRFWSIGLLPNKN